MVILALGAQFLAVSCAVGVSVAYIHKALWSSADAVLQTRIVKLLALVGEDEVHPHRLEFDADQADVPSGDLFYIESDQGNAVAGNPAWIGEIGEHLRGARSWTWNRHGKTFRAAALRDAAILDQEDDRIPQLRATLFYAMPVDGTVSQVERASRVAILVGLLSVVLSAALTWWAVGRGMRPLTDFVRYADRIDVERAEFTEPAGVTRNSELIPLARALTSLENRVRQAFQRERQFLSDAAHELKTAVTIEKSTLQLLEQERPSEAEYRSGVNQAIEDTNRIERLVHDMLLLSSLEHARQRTPASSSVVRLGDTIVSAIEQLQPVSQIHSVSCIYDDKCESRVRGTESDLTRLWINLLENAVRHSKAGSEVSVETAEEGETTCRVRIIDQGSGIDSAYLPHVFERFYRSDVSRSRSTGGFGLGLSIAGAIVKNLEGTIQISSAPGKGTTVEVNLPYTSAPIESVPHATLSLFFEISRRLKLPFRIDFAKSHSGATRTRRTHMSTVMKQAILIASCIVFGASTYAAEKPVPRAKLPAVVQKTMDEQSQGATVKRYVKDNEDGQLEYEAEMVVNGHSKDISVAPDGTLIEIEEQVESQSLPDDVLSGLRAKAGKGKITKVESLTKQGAIVAYEAQVMTGGRHSEVQVGPHGETLAHEE